MAWDLALASSGDLIFTPGDLMFSPSADISGISGVDLIEQRMLMRLKLHRGSWVYDDDGSFGSQLYRLIGHNPNTAAAQADAIVREALRPMDEIDVGEVHIMQQDTSLVLIIDYRVLDVQVSAADENQQRLEIVISGGSA